MVIDGKTVVNQSFWNTLKPDVQAAITKGGVVVMSDSEWAKLGRMLKKEADELRHIREHGHGRTMTTSDIKRQLGL